MKKLLAIANDDSLLSLLWYCLHPSYLEIIVASSGWVGLQLARVERPDLILCSTNLPGLDGYEVLQAVRADAAIASTNLILVSPHQDLESRCMAIALGADDYLTQPVTLEQMKMAIAAQLPIPKQIQQVA